MDRYKRKSLITALVHEFSYATFVGKILANAETVESLSFVMTWPLRRLLVIVCSAATVVLTQSIARDL